MFQLFLSLDTFHPRTVRLQIDPQLVRGLRNDQSEDLLLRMAPDPKTQNHDQSVFANASWNNAKSSEMKSFLWMTP